VALLNLSLHHFTWRLGPSHHVPVPVLLHSPKWLARYCFDQAPGRRRGALAVEDEVVAMKGSLDAVDHELQLVIFSKYYSKH